MLSILGWLAYAPRILPGDMVNGPERVLDALIEAIRDELTTQIVGLYVYGSIIDGDFDSNASDLDLLVLLSKEVGGLDLEAFGRIHRRFLLRFPDWDNRLDIIYIGQESLRGFRTRVGSFAVVSPGEPLHLRIDVGDWIQSWYLVREGSRALIGRFAADVIPEIARDEFEAAIVDDLLELATNGTDARGGALAYRVLTACRTLITVRSERLSSKTQAAEWTRVRLPHWSWLIDAALACRRSRGAVGFDDDQTRSAALEFIREVAAALVVAPPSRS